MSLMSFREEEQNERLPTHVSFSLPLRVSIACSHDLLPVTIDPVRSRCGTLAEQRTLALVRRSVPLRRRQTFQPSAHSAPSRRVGPRETEAHRRKRSSAKGASVATRKRGARSWRAVESSCRRPPTPRRPNASSRVVAEDGSPRLVVESSRPGACIPILFRVRARGKIVKEGSSSHSFVVVVFSLKIVSHRPHGVEFGGVTVD